MGKTFFFKIIFRCLQVCPDEANSFSITAGNGMVAAVDDACGVLDQVGIAGSSALCTQNANLAVDSV